MEEENKRPLFSYFNNRKEVYNSDIGNMKEFEDGSEKIKELNENITSTLASMDDGALKTEIKEIHYQVLLILMKITKDKELLIEWENDMYKDYEGNNIGRP